ncbi:MAG: electron transport complex subunit RsxC [Ruminococcaceae bacterium]|nr:electron transport complex subunit RsxC [Oscillospiraceae bacterium]
MKYTFKGGLHPSDGKEATENKSIITLAAPEEMVYPMVQHIGAPCTPCVAVGDTVTVGQKIGDSDSFVSAPVHSTVSGTVKAVEPRRHPNGRMVESIVVENDGLYTLHPDIHPYADTDKLTREEKISLVREAGVVGMGGACFPTFIKLNPPADKKIDVCIVNGAECEPYLTSDHRVMIESPVPVFEGLKIIMEILGVDKGYIGIEENKPEAIKTMRSLEKDYEGISVKVLKTKYPQGSEKHLIKALTGKEVPSGKLPADVGVVVNNVDTCTSVYNAVTRHQPLLSRIVTVSGSGINKPSNFRVPIGTPFEYVIQAAGGIKDETRKVVMGGPMMGVAQFDLSVPVVKGTSGILALTDRELKFKNTTPCIRCGKCVQRCPMNLMPLYLNAYAAAKDMAKCIEYNIMDCIECGICSYTCQSEQHPTQNIKLMKAQIAAARKQVK